MSTLKIKAYGGDTPEKYIAKVAATRLEKKYPGQEARQRPRTPGKREMLEFIEEWIGEKRETV